MPVARKTSKATKKHEIYIIAKIQHRLEMLQAQKLPPPCTPPQTPPAGAGTSSLLVFLFFLSFDFRHSRELKPTFSIFIQSVVLFFSLIFSQPSLCWSLSDFLLILELICLIRN